MFPCNNIFAFSFPFKLYSYVCDMIKEIYLTVGGTVFDPDYGKKKDPFDA